MGIEEQITEGKDFPGQIIKAPGGSIITTTLNGILNWARSNSLWPLTFGTRCCAIEFMASGASRHDFARFGMEVARATPRQADMIVISGSITYKMAPVLKRLYDQIPFFYNSYSVVKGADHIIPVDVYIPGCPPRPEAFFYGLMKLQEKIKGENFKTKPEPFTDFI